MTTTNTISNTINDASLFKFFILKNKQLLKLRHKNLNEVTLALEYVKNTKKQT